MQKPAGPSRVRTSGTPALLKSLHPIRDEKVCLMGGFVIAIRGPDEAFAVGGKHREGVEIGMGGDLFEAGAVLIDHVEIEAAGIFLVRHVGGKNNACAA